MVLALAFLYGAQASAAPSQQRVFNTPGGYEIGVIRDGDRVEILEYQTLYADGRNSRWAYVKYGDAYSGAEGWINMENIHTQEAPAATEYGNYSQAPYVETPTAAQTTIRDMDISCYKNSRDSIQGCNLTMEVEIQANAQSNLSDELVLVCKAELHWFRVGGGKQVATSQAQDYVYLDRGNLRRKLDLNFDFGQAGATGATVENQDCQTQASTNGGYGNYSTYR